MLVSYFVTDDTRAENMRSALGRLIEYAKFMEGELGRDGSTSFVDEIIRDDNIHIRTEIVNE